MHTSIKMQDMAQKTLFIITSILLCIAACVNGITNTTNSDFFETNVTTLLYIPWFETKYLYCIIHAIVIIPIIALSFDKKVYFARTYTSILPAILITGLLFIMWDFAKTHIHVWGFNSKYLLNIFIWNLPIEELLFFITIPTAFMFIYVCFEIYALMPRHNVPDIITPTLIIGLIIIGIYFWQYTYTSTVTLFAASTLCLHLAIGNAYIRLKTYLVFIVSLIPFFFINGILTGAFQNEPIVWYNTEELLNIRIISIPIEDIIYLLPLLLINTSLFEWFRQKFSQKSPI